VVEIIAQNIVFTHKTNDSGGERDTSKHVNSKRIRTSRHQAEPQ